MARRSRLELYIDVLSSISNNFCKPTNIMQEANLSWKSLQRILLDMGEQGMIDVVVEKSSRKRDRRTLRTYGLTSKGVDVLKYFRGHLSDIVLDEVALVKW